MVIQLFACDHCGEAFADRRLAVACEEREPFGFGWVVGDIVAGAFGVPFPDNVGGDWIVNPPVSEWLSQNLARRQGRQKYSPFHPTEMRFGKCQGPCCTLGYFYVVTAAETIRHNMRYHLLTRGTTYRRYREGYIDSDPRWHEKRRAMIVAPGVPASVREEAPALVGQRFDTRLEVWE